MKVLIASVGNQWESLVAKRFEHALWYLVGDTETRALQSIQQFSPHDRHAAIEKAAAEGATVVVAGKFGERTTKLLRTHNMRVALVHGITTSEAIANIQSGEIPLAEPDALGHEKGAFLTTLQRLIPQRRKAGMPMSAVAYNSDSPRGHHHLQQYAGRGH
ncbi:MAG: hypothetical protein C4326_01605 [Ignavibacteria bacterium]